MNLGIISRRYATALYMYAHKHGKDKQIYKEAIKLSNSFLQFEALPRTLANPVLPAAQKEKLLVLCSGGEVSDEFLNFIRLVIRRKREEFLQVISLMYQDIYRKERKLLHVDIVTAVPIDKKTEKEIVDRLEQLTHETVDIVTTVDPEIIGGYIMRWDTYRWDASIRSQLRQIKKELKETVKIE